MNRKKLLILSLNANGLNNRRKTSAIESWLKGCYPDVIFIQETHFRALTSASKMLKNWAGFYCSSVSGAAQRGVSIFIGKHVQFHVEASHSDTSGRWTFLHGKINQTNLILATIYAPVIDDPLPILQLKQALSGIPGQIIWGGDFNFLQNPAVDSTKKDRRQNKPQVATALLSCKSDLDILDNWRLNNPAKREYSCYSAKYDSSSRLDFFLLPITLKLINMNI